MGERLVYVDGDLVREAEAVVSAFDSGLHFADGCFESIRVYSGRVFRMDEHLDRLFDSVRLLRLPLALRRTDLGAAILGWLNANRVSDAFHFKVLVTRGRRIPPRLDLRFAPGPATVLMMGSDVHGSGRRAVRLIASSVRRPAADALDPRIKTLSWGSNVLARLEVTERGVDDAVMLDVTGTVAAATSSNLFAIRDGRLLTPHPRACLRGITRQAVMDLAADLGMPVVEADLSLADLDTADELFLTGTSSELAPVAEFEGRGLPGGEGGGPWTARLLEAYRRLAKSSGTPLR
jgi:branched-chain amino acid aminotransferase